MRPHPERNAGSEQVIYSERLSIARHVFESA